MLYTLYLWLNDNGMRYDPNRKFKSPLITRTQFYWISGIPSKGPQIKSNWIDMLNFTSPHVVGPYLVGQTWIIVQGTRHPTPPPRNTIFEKNDPIGFPHGVLRNLVFVLPRSKTILERSVMPLTSIKIRPFGEISTEIEHGKKSPLWLSTMGLRGGQIKFDFQFRPFTPDM